MMADVISGVMQMQWKQDIKEFTTEELLQELVSRGAVKLQRDDETVLLSVTARKGNKMNRARERPSRVLFFYVEK